MSIARAAQIVCQRAIDDVEGALETMFELIELLGLVEEQCDDLYNRCAPTINFYRDLSQRRAA